MYIQLLLELVLKIKAKPLIVNLVYNVVFDAVLQNALPSAVISKPVKALVVYNRPNVYLASYFTSDVDKFLTGNMIIYPKNTINNILNKNKVLKTSIKPYIIP